MKNTTDNKIGGSSDDGLNTVNRKMDCIIERIFISAVFSISNFKFRKNNVTELQKKWSGGGNANNLSQ